MNDSVFNIPVRLENGGIIYNTASRRMLKLTDFEYEAWIRKDFSIFLDKELNYLYNSGFIKK